MARETVLEVANLSVDYAAVGGYVGALDDVSFAVGAGETIAIVGESGCGKSTLGRAIVGLLPEGADARGQIRLDGVDLLRLPQHELRRRRGAEVGLVFQEPSGRLDPLMTVEQHFEETLRAHGFAGRSRERRRHTLQMLQSVGIPPTRLTAYPHELSGGMCQRVMIALALALRPKLVIADEPTTALDVVVEAQIVELLTELTRSLGTSLLLITHDLGIAATVCERTIVLYAGRIAEDGPTPSVFTEPAHPYTADLLSATITLDTVELRSIPGSPPSLGSPPPGCRYHPRCAHAMEVCTTTQPHETRDGSRSAWCWLRDVAAVDEAVPSTRVAR